jgi:phosphatidylglycerophosphate synthase
MERLERRLPLPPVPPLAWSLLSVVLSGLAFVVRSRRSRIVLVSAVLMADWLDGATARRQGLVGRRGYVADVAVDRTSEPLLFLADRKSTLGRALLGLWVLNAALAVVSLARGRHLALPLRFVYLVGLVARRD